MTTHFWGNIVPRKWMIWACEPNEVYYLVSDKKNYFWVTLDDIEDYTDVIVFDTKKETQAFIKRSVAEKFVPHGVNLFQYSLVIPSFNESDKKLWAENEGKVFEIELKESPLVFKGRKRRK